MPNTLGIDYAADHEEQERDRGLEITYGGNDYPAIVSVPTFGREFEADGSGYYVTKTITVTVRIAVIGESVANGEKITYDGEEYRIGDVSKDTESGWYILQCEGVTG